MEEKQFTQVAIVYKTRGRDLLPLTEACKLLNFSICIAETESDFKRLIRSTNTICIIVTLGADEEGVTNMKVFCKLAGDVFEPEDADVEIIYSTEGSTPKGWSGSLDPRPIQAYDIEPYFAPVDTAWQATIEKLKRIKSRVGYCRNSSFGIVSIGFAREADVSFPTEAAYLMRSAFKDMSNITIEFPRQGLSGSIACVVQPVNTDGEKCPRVFVKIYKGQEKAQRDLQNILSYVQKLGADCFPQYQYFRRYRGKAYSLLVTDLVIGPHNKAITFKEMITSEEFTLKDVQSFIREILSIFYNGWKPLSTPERPDLIDSYLKKFLEDKEKRINIDSENICHKWFGNYADNAGLETKIRKSLPGDLSKGTSLKVCHGDLHADNIMVKKISGNLLPVFIDFSRTEETHLLKDLVTLESDMIIRCLGGIRHFSNKKIVRSFLESLTSDAVISVNEWTYDADELLQLEKVQIVIRELRNHAISSYRVSLSEYECAAMLKTLEVLSYGKLPHDQNVRATTYVTYLVERLRAMKSI